MNFRFLFSLLTLFILLFSCKKETEEVVTTIASPEFSFTGNTMGTTYLVKYIGEQQADLPALVDSLLIDINQSVSTYIPESTIAKINSSKKERHHIDQHFLTNFIASRAIYEQTSGSFNPAIMPLVNYWGFGFEKFNKLDKIDTVEVNRLTQLVNFDSFEVDGLELIKNEPDAQLDFSAIAKGYGVDQVGELLDKNGLSNYLVEIGGELITMGLNKEHKPWLLGIRKPIPKEKNTLVEKIPLTNRAMATSGNYENFIALENKETIAHTINPKTGFPQSVSEELLSTTVLAPTCMAADALATAFKVMGLEKSKQLLPQLENIDVFFVYRTKQGEINTYSTLE